MMLRARHLFLAWIAFGVLQLALLGVGGMSVQVGIHGRGARAQSELTSVALTKRVLSSDLNVRHAAPTPFAPSESFGIERPRGIGGQSPAWQPLPAASALARGLPSARAPPARS